MSVETLPHSVFEDVQKPDILDAYSVGSTVLSWVTENVPHAFSVIDLTDDDISEVKGNCFEQTIAETGVIQEQLSLPAGIMLYASGSSYCHSTALAQVPEFTDSDGQVVWIEPPVYAGEEGYLTDISGQARIKTEGPREVTKLRKPSEYLEYCEQNKILPSLLAENLPVAMSAGNFCHYYFIDPKFSKLDKRIPKNQPWQIKNTIGIRQDTPIQKDGFSFVITDPTQGKNMLESVGRLGNLYKNDREQYCDVYEDLIHNVPDFINFPTPRKLSSV